MTHDEDTRVGIEIDRVTNTTSTDIPGSRPGVDLSWNLEKFKKTFDIQIEYMNDLEAVFDLIHIDTSIANAFRRIMIAEVPTLAIEYVFVENNTSVIQDEVLASRLGLIPLDASPDLLRWFNKDDPEYEPTDYDTVVLKLKAKCTHNPKPKPDAKEPEDKYINSTIYSSQIEFEPQGQQLDWFPNGIKATNPNIPIVKLRPGQEIDLTMHCILGIGSDHAKFSPVAPATYRLLPTIDLLQPIKGDLAIKLQKCFPRGVIGINSKDGSAFVDNVRKDTVSREVLNHKEFHDKVRLGRRRDHFIYSLETTGALPPSEVFIKSVRILKHKCEVLRKFDLRR